MGNWIKKRIKKQLHLFSSFLACRKKKIPCRVIWLCDIHINAIPAGTIIVHPFGICIRDGVKLGQNVDIRQHVTIGYRHLNNPDEPPAIIGSNVFIGANASILGAVNIGDNVQIGAHSLILSDVPPNTTVFGLWKN